MAVGDVVSDISASVAAASYATIQPAGTVEWCINNIYHEDAVSFEFYDGTNSIIFDTDTAAGVLRGPFRVTNANYLRVRNDHASVAKDIAYDGVITHA